MEGSTLSHYEIQEQLGGGGMGVVYKALDTRLRRTVALKFLRPHLVPSADAKRRFMLEAQAASALDHANICTIYEVDETADGQMFLAMSCYEGETLDNRIARGPIPVNEAVDIATQIARGLTTAHAAGLVHRDIKPANLMLCADGVVKILDFGLTKHADQTRHTREGALLGTIAYMAPEQVRGDSVDARTDVWALGVVLYEMLTGQMPFRGGNDAAILNAITSTEAGRPSAENPSIPTELDAIVAKALSKNPSKRYATAGVLLSDLERLVQPAYQSAAQVMPWKRGVFGLAAVLAIGAIAVWYWNLESEQARGEIAAMIREIEAAINADDSVTAYDLAMEVESRDPDNAYLTDLWPRFSRVVSIESEPSGAVVLQRPYAQTDREWRELGTTPLESVLPLGVNRFHFESNGYAAEDRVDVRNSISVTLLEEGALDEGMIRGPTGNFPEINLIGVTLDPFELDEFAIDRYEVSNTEFAEFIADGGYSNPEYWTELIRELDANQDWQAYVDETFVNKSQTHGPATWESSRPPADQRDHPVTGISWFEAAAYASWKGRHLPTLYHFAAVSGIDIAFAILPLSNFSGIGTAPVGDFAGIGPFGTYDMAGNAREWLYNDTDSSDERLILGGAFGDVDHMFYTPEFRSPYERDSGTGFRTVAYSESEANANLEQPIPPGYRFPLDRQPVDEATYDNYAAWFSYTPRPLNATEWEPLAKPFDGAEAYRARFTSSDPSEPMSVYLFLPEDAARPLQSIVFVGGQTITNPGNSEPRIRGLMTAVILRRLVLNGRAMVMPVIAGTFERSNGRNSRTEEEFVDSYIAQVNDVRQTVNFLYAHPDDFDPEKIAYLGISWGAARGINVLALDERFKTGVFLDGGFIHARIPEQTDGFNFAYHVNQPVLMLNGSKDSLIPIELREMQFDALGGRAAGNEIRVWDTNHGVALMVPEQATETTIEWLNEHLGQPN